MGNVRLRIAGLYFNEIVAMEGDGPYTVKEVMDQYQTQSSQDNSLPVLEFQPDTGNEQIGNTGSMSQISVRHPGDAGNNLVYKFYDYTAPDTFDLNANSDGSTLDVRRRPAGTYTIREAPIFGGSGVLAWQYYVQGANGEGTNRSKTKPREGFTVFGAARIVEPGDLVTWRSVGILLLSKEAMATS